MAASVPLYSMPQKEGTPGVAADLGYQGSFGKTLGATLGSLGGVPGTVVGTIFGAIGDFLFSGAGSRAAKPPEPPPMTIPFKTMQPYQPIASTMRDPGASAPPPIQPNVQLARGAAATNLKKKLFGRQGAV